MADLSAWLLEQVAEDERMALEQVQLFEGWITTADSFGWPPQRVLAECAAKRQTIDEAFAHAETVDGEWGCCHSAQAIRAGVVDYPDDDDAPEPLPDECCGPRTAARLLRIVASVYADRPGFQPEWAAQ